jgi:peptidylprolyl isomerase
VFQVKIHLCFLSINGYIRAANLKGKIMKSILIVLFSFVFIYGCSNEVTLKSGVKYKDVKVGNGAEVKDGNLVEIHFKGWIVKDSSDVYTDWSMDSTKQKDMIADSYQMGQAMKFVLGSESFIKGSEEGMIGMKPGGQRIIIIPANCGYGADGMGPIPPNTDIKVYVEMVSTKEVPQVKMWDVDSTLFKTTASGLKYAIIKEGEGPLVQKQQQVKVHYSGFLLNGTKFDSSVERDEPLTFMAGVGQVIPGWDEGLLLLKKGSKAKFVIPDSLAYGDRDLGKIPPKSTLIFDVEIIDVLPAQPQGQPHP